MKLMTFKVDVLANVWWNSMVWKIIFIFANICHIQNTLFVH